MSVCNVKLQLTFLSQYVYFSSSISLKRSYLLRTCRETASLNHILMLTGPKTQLRLSLIHLAQSRYLIKWLVSHDDIFFFLSLYLFH